MPYPKFWRRLNEILGNIGGIICFIVACMLLINAVMRYIFKSPTSWMTDYACYLHCLALFLGCAYTFQVHGHVGVDMLRRYVDKKTNNAHNRLGTRIMSIAGHLQTLVFLSFTAYAVFSQMIKSHEFGSMTEATYPMAQWILYLVIFIGCILMIVTVILIILDLFTKSDEFIE